MILFLDFDGVLHPEPCFDQTRLFCRRVLLEECLRDFPEVQIVISSTWKDRHSLDDLKKIFAPDIAGRIVGVTPNWRELPELQEVIPYRRHSEVEGWLRQTGQPWAQWVALDDKPWLFKPFLPNLVTCDGEVGLNDAAIQTLQSKLAAASSRI